ncbi:MAG TPA: serine/threonine-protein kinase [Vicinamibacteria bacterium]|nr:serine/threonine-protein kinase [Vicinamibacteria bacterium]
MARGNPDVAPPGSSLAAGELLDGKYRIEALLGEGGMGAVYRATHVGTRRTVAVKVIRPRLSGEEEFLARFRREAEAAGRLRHPNVVDVTDFGSAHTSSGLVAYLVMEYLDGCTLADVLAEERRLPVRWAVDVLEQVSSGVEEAHAQGVVHRDLKPANIWLEPNRRGGYTVKLLDFGLARLSGIEPPAPSAAPPPEAGAPTEPAADLSEEPTLLRTPAHGAPAEATAVPATTAELTRLGSVMGTPLYMSPEQCRGETIDARSDIYSLGVVAYRMLAGEAPFSGSTEELLRLHATAEPLPLPRRRLPRRLSAVVLSALAKDPARRPQTAAGFGAALRASSDSTGSLLQRAVVFYSEHFSALLRLSVIAHLPLMIVVALLAAADGLLPGLAIPTSRLSALGPALFAGLVAANLLAYGLVSAGVVPMVVQSIVAPLRAMDVRTAFRAIGRRWLTFAAASLATVLLVMAGLLLLLLPGIAAAVACVLYGPVVVMEGAGVRASLRRSRQLVWRAPWTAVVIALLQFALPVAVWLAAVTMKFTFRLGEGLMPKELGFSFSVSGRSVLWQLLNLLVVPLAAVMTSLLYLRMRHFGAESLRDTAAVFEALSLPRSRWEARLRSRLQQSGRTQSSLPRRE